MRERERVRVRERERERERESLSAATGQSRALASDPCCSLHFFDEGCLDVMCFIRFFAPASQSACSLKLQTVLDDDDNDHDDDNDDNGQ